MSEQTLVPVDPNAEPEIRVQALGDDTVLEVTETVIKKRRILRSDLLRQKDYFEQLIAKGTAGLDAVNAQLAQIDDARAPE